MARTVLTLVFLAFAATCASAQTGVTLQGRVLDATGATVPGAIVTVSNDAIGVDRSATADGDGRYVIIAVPAGSYDVSAAASGFRTARIEDLTVDVGRTLVHDFQLDVGPRTEALIVSATAPLIDRASSTVGHVVTTRAIQSVPLNGHHLTDLAVLAPGTVAPSQTGFSTTPIRGVGALAINTSGNREEAVGFVVNGVSSNNLAFGSLMFEPPVASIQQFKVDNSVFPAEYGHVSGAIVNIVTRSGTDDFKGDAHAFVRNEALDARNFFELTSAEPHRFERTQFGGSLGGPLVPGRTFFFVSYEGLRQRQGLDMNSLVPSDEERNRSTDPVVRRLIELIPRANFVDALGGSRFVGSANAVADQDRGTLDVSHNVGAGTRWHGFYGRQRIYAVEPASQGTSIPGFGQVSRPLRTLITLDETRVLGPATVNEIRFGRSSLDGLILPSTPLNPRDFGIANGVDGAIGLPQITVAGSLTFGGPGAYPQGRKDASYVVTNTLSYVRGRHSLRLGGEYRHFKNENVTEGTGVLSVPSMASFLTGEANAFSITLGRRVSHIDQRAVAVFVQDRVALVPSLSLDLGLRYEWHVSPTERANQFVVFDAARVSLLRVGEDVDVVYRQNNRNVEPRAGLAWDLSGNGRTVLRAAYGWAVDQPGTRAVRDTASNPPFATPLTAAGSIPLGAPLSVARPAGLAPTTIDRGFTNASLRSWNVNVQRALAGDVVAMAGYFGSRGRNLQLWRNINQPVDGVRPFPALAADSPIQPGTPLGNITQVESSGYSSYRALWLSVTARSPRAPQLDASYTWSRSLDTNSLNSLNFAIQDSRDIDAQYGPSDFDARHRFIASVTYEPPLTGHALLDGWLIAAVTQSQSGNPVNIVTSNSTLNGTPYSVRPDVTGPIRVIGAVDQWFDTAVFQAAGHFGNLGRNAVTGPAFHSTDVSVSKVLRRSDRADVQLRVDVFDVFNHPNFGPPGNVVGSPTFGRITRTRLPTGEGGSSRQVQLAVRVSY